MALEVEDIKLELDGRWTLEDLSDTTKEYVQLYGFAYSLVEDLPATRQSEVDYIYGKFPWRGGYSTVNFFDQLFHKIPPKLRPQVKRIQYASPGFIELTQIALVAMMVAKIVGYVCDSLAKVHDLYRSIQKEASALKLAKIDIADKDLELTKKQLAFCDHRATALARALGLTPDMEAMIDSRVGGNPAMKLKILLSVYRRVQPLALKQFEGKLRIRVPDERE